MRLSFRGFLLKYCKELTSSNTTSLKKLFSLADNGFSRAYEPILLLAICDQRESYLLKQAHDSSILATYTQFLVDWKTSKKPIEAYLQSLETSNRFRRPYDAWKANGSRIETDRKILKNVPSALLALLEAKHLTRAQACMLTNVNKGNFYAFLKGDTAKLSRKTAMRVYRQIYEL